MVKHCPRCQEPLDVKELAEVEIDKCPRCQGMWFDEDEFRQSKDQIDPDLAWLDFDIWKHKDQFQLHPDPVQCPRCCADLYTVGYGETGVEVDACAQCHGIWLDGGEFEKIIQALHEELLNKDVSEYVKASLQQGKELFSGPEDIGSEWKDFTAVMRMMQYRLFAERPRLLRELIEGQKGAPIW